MSQTSSSKMQKDVTKVTTKENPVVRADKAYESIRQTSTLNQRLQQIGVVSTSFGLKKSSVR